MDVVKYVVTKVAKKINLTPDILDYAFAAQKMGKPAEVVFPLELLPLTARLILKGFLNAMLVHINLDWIWPFWIEKQFDPTSTSFMVRGHNPAAINSSHRNWVGICYPDEKIETVIDPRHLVSPWFDGWSLDSWVLNYTDVDNNSNFEDIRNNSLFPSKEESAKQEMLNNLPLIQTTFNKNDIQLTLTTFNNLIQGEEIILHNAMVTNLSKKTQKLKLVFSLRPYNVEGIALIKNITIQDRQILVNNKKALFFTEAPENIYLANLNSGDCLFKILKQKPEYKNNIKCKTGLASAALVYDLNLLPKSQINKNIFLYSNTAKEKKSFSLDFEETIKIKINEEKLKVENLFKQRLKNTVKIKTVDEHFNNSFAVNTSHILTLYDDNEICPGVFTYHHFWFRDAAYQITALDKVGLQQEAEKILLTYPQRQTKDGFFRSQEGEWDANGQAIWTLLEHYKYSKNLAFLKEVYKSIRKGVLWIEKKRKATQKKDSPHYGLLPAGLSAEHLGPNEFYYWDDLWALAGIKSAIYAAQVLNKGEDEELFSAIFNSFWKDFEKSLSYVQKKIGIKCLPSSPYRRIDAAIISCVAALYPLKLFPAHSEIITNTLEQLEKNFFVEEAFFQHIVHAGFGTYLTMQVAHCHLFRREKKAQDIMQWILKHFSQTFTLAEAINPHSREGGIGDGHHGWAVADWLHLIRSFFFFEENNRLVIFPSIPDEWLLSEVKIKNAISYFGKINNLSLTPQEKNKFLLNINANFNDDLESIEINLPLAIKSIKNKDLKNIGSLEKTKAIIFPQSGDYIIEV